MRPQGLSLPRQDVDHPFIAAFKAMAARVRRARRIERARAELYAMSDHELADLGIHRADINHVVTTGDRHRSRTR